MKRQAINRRTLLRGLAAGGTAVMVGLPILDGMLNSHGTAFADESPLPVRLITWFFGNGVLLNRWVPGGIRNPVKGPGYPLSEELASLAPVQDYVSVVSGFHNKSKYLITHHEGMTIFNAYTMADKGQGPGFFSNARGPTIDQVYASYLQGQADKPSIVGGIHLGVVNQESQADFGTTMHNLSHVNHLSPNPPNKNPQQVHQTFLDLFTPPDDPSKPSRLAVVDSILADAKELQKRLGVVDKQRVDGHLSALADLQTKINALPPLCEIPGQPPETSDVVNGIPAVNQAMADLIAFAFACDVTRIATLLLVGGASEAPVLPGQSSQHALSHAVSANALPYGGQSWKPDGPGAPAIVENGPITDYNKGIVFQIQQLAVLLQSLKNMPDAGGTNVLDNTVVFASSDCSDGWTHDIRDQPILLCGRAAGRLVYPGIHFRDSNQRNASDVTLTALQAVIPDAVEIGSTSYLLEGVTDPAYSNNPVVELKGT